MTSRAVAHVSRQALADGPIKSSGHPLRRARTVARHIARTIAFGFAPLRRLLEHPSRSGNDAAQYWDRLYKFRDILDGTIDIDLRNTIVATLIRSLCDPLPAVLDVGCAAGSLVTALPPFSKYLGLDVSPHAIELAQKLATNNVAFFAVGLQEFDLAEKWNAIVFGEVLYYLSVEDAVRELVRYSRALEPEGIAVISMKNDPKSRVIFRAIRDRYKWRRAVLWQPKDNSPEYHIRINQERPAYLIAAVSLQG